MQSKLQYLKLELSDTSKFNNCFLSVKGKKLCSNGIIETGTFLIPHSFGDLSNSIISNFENENYNLNDQSHNVIRYIDNAIFKGKITKTKNSCKGSITKVVTILSHKNNGYDICNIIEKGWTYKGSFNKNFVIHGKGKVITDKEKVVLKGNFINGKVTVSAILSCNTKLSMIVALLKKYYQKDVLLMNEKSLFVSIVKFGRVEIDTEPTMEKQLNGIKIIEQLYEIITKYSSKSFLKSDNFHYYQRHIPEKFHALMLTNNLMLMDRIKSIEKNKGYVNIYGIENWNILFYAILLNNNDLIRNVIKYKSSLNTTLFTVDNEKCSPLHLAAIKLNLNLSILPKIYNKIQKWNIKDLFKCNQDGLNVIDLCMIYNRIDIIDQLMLCVDVGSIDVMRYFYPFMQQFISNGIECVFVCN